MGQDRYVGHGIDMYYGIDIIYFWLSAVEKIEGKFKNKKPPEPVDSGGFSNLITELSLISNSYTESSSVSRRPGVSSCFPHSRRSYPQTTPPESPPQRRECVYKFCPRTNGRERLLPHSPRNFPKLPPAHEAY